MAAPASRRLSPQVAASSVDDAARAVEPVGAVRPAEEPAGVRGAEDEDDGAVSSTIGSTGAGGSAARRTERGVARLGRSGVRRTASGGRGVAGSFTSGSSSGWNSGSDRAAG